METSKFKTKWYLVTWYCPNDTKESRRLRSKFNKMAFAAGVPVYPLKENVCARFLIGAKKIEELVHVLPPDSEMRVIEITDKQYERMRVYRGKMRKVK